MFRPTLRRATWTAGLAVALVLAGCSDTSTDERSAETAPQAAPTTTIAPAEPAEPPAAAEPEAAAAEEPPGPEPTATAPTPPADRLDPAAPSSTAPPAQAPPTTVGWVTTAGPPPTAPDGSSCPSPEDLAVAVTTDLATSVTLGSVVDVRCAQRWATGWTNPDPADPLLPDPAIVLFERGPDRWVAVSGGMETDCLDRVPREVWPSLDCL